MADKIIIVILFTILAISVVFAFVSDAILEKLNKIQKTLNEICK